MNPDELSAALQTLQQGNEAESQFAYAAIAELARLDPVECAPILARALLTEAAAGPVRTPRLLTLLGLTRQPSPECLPLCLEVLRTAVTEESFPSDALIGTAAVIARTDTRRLLPDLTNQNAAAAGEQDIAQALLPLLSLTGHFLRELPDNAVTSMARWLWADCASLDLMTLADVVGLQIEFVGLDDEVLELFVDIGERVAAKPDEKRYVVNRLAELAAVDAAALEELKNAWQASVAAPPAEVDDAAPLGALDPEPPAPDPRVDEWLAAFSEGREQAVDLAQTALDTMFDEPVPSYPLPWWVAVTADASPPWRRRDDIRWALVRGSVAVRTHKDKVSNIPPSVLLRWLDTPQLLDANGTWAALDLLGRQRPDVLVQHCLHRAITASGEHPEISLGEMWQVVTDADPSAVLLLVSRWAAAGFGTSPLLTLLVGLLITAAQERPELVDELRQAVASIESASTVTGVAQQLIDGLHNAPSEEPA